MEQQFPASRHDGRYLDQPTVLVFADSEPSGARARAAVEATGGRVAGIAGTADALDRLSRQAALDAVVVEVEHDAGPALDRLLGRLEDAARTGRYPSLITVPSALLDAATAQVEHEDVVLLCDPNPAERAVAMTMLLTRRPMLLNDGAGEGGAGRLRQLSEEVGRIARTLAALSTDERGGLALADRRPPFAGRPGSGQPIDGAMVRAIIRARRLREQYFKAELFADPAWDILLDLLAARLEKRRVAVSSLCIAASVPPTTALRWIRTLTSIGHIQRAPDPLDGRRVFVELSDNAAQAMTAYLLAARAAGPMLG